jgi:ribonuclease G
MATELIINASLPETRIALMEDGEIQELLIERASGKGIVGNIYKGRVTRVLPGMQAAFVDIGLEKAAFLYVDDVFVHSEVFEDEAEDPSALETEQEGGATLAPLEAADPEQEAATAADPADSEGSASEPQDSDQSEEDSGPEEYELDPEDLKQSQMDLDEADDEEGSDGEVEGEEEDRDEDGSPASMGPPSGGDEGEVPGTVSAKVESSSGSESVDAGEPSQEVIEAQASTEAEEEGDDRGKSRGRRGRRGGKNRKRDRGPAEEGVVEPRSEEHAIPEHLSGHVRDAGDQESDRAEMSHEAESLQAAMSEGEDEGAGGRPSVDSKQLGVVIKPVTLEKASQEKRPEFREPRGRDRRIRTKEARPAAHAPVNIQDLLKEGQEVLVQVAKDPISSKGARLTCHISLPGRHLVCMPTIDHVGVSRRIERDDERRRLRDFVERNRPKKLGFIVRTASAASRAESERRVKQDVDYLSRLWDEIREKAAAVSAPALVYEDLNSVLRAIRDWVNEEIDKIVVDSRFHYQEMQRFVSNFMPSLGSKLELYQGDLPIFDAYNISTDLARALERKVWLKSGGYLVIDQAEALVAIDVNTGRYVGKRSLEDTILKTNLEAVKEIAYQLRLRNCGGIIILDLIDMEKEENKYRVFRALEEELKKDRARPTILKISELGLIEMTRKRTRDTIIRSLCEPCAHCEGKGFIKSKQTVAYEILRDIEREGMDRDVSKILVQAHADVIDILAIEERDSLDQLERRYRKSLYLQAVADFHPEQFEVVPEKRGVRSDEKILERVRDQVARNAQESGRGDPRRRGRDGRRDEKQNDRNRDRNDRDRGKNARPIQPLKPVAPLSALEALEEDSGQGDSELPSQTPVIGNADPDSVGNISHPRRGDRNGHQDRGGQDRRPQVQGHPKRPYIAPEVLADPDTIGNRVTTKIRSPYEVPSHGGLISGFGNQETGTPPEDGFETEEDRQAFLRAQAAQDQAIRNLSSAGSSFMRGNSNSGQSRGGGGGGGAGGRRDQNQKWGRNGKNKNRRNHGKFRPRSPGGGEGPSPMILAAPPSGDGNGGGGGGSSE